MTIEINERNTKTRGVDMGEFGDIACHAPAIFARAHLLGNFADNCPEIGIGLAHHDRNMG